MGVYKACALFIIWFWGSGTLPASPKTESPGKNAELQKQIAEVEEKFKEQKKGDPRFYFCCWFRAPFSFSWWRDGMWVSGMACRAGGWLAYLLAIALGKVSWEFINNHDTWASNYDFCGVLLLKIKYENLNLRTLLESPEALSP